MNDQKSDVRQAHHRSTAEHDAVLQRLAVAHRRLQEADTPEIRNELTQAVDAARSVGVGWTRIGDTLGIASGNAYQRYRKRPTRPTGAAT
jgi:hypothetical protein